MERLSTTDLTATLREAFAQQPSPRRVFALQFLDARYEQGLIQQVVYETLSGLVRKINSLSHTIFRGEWITAHEGFLQITAAIEAVRTLLVPFLDHAILQSQRAKDVRDGMPILRPSDADGLHDRLLQWEGSLKTLYKPRLDDAMMFAHICAQYDDSVWLPFMQSERMEQTWTDGILVVLLHDLREDLGTLEKQIKSAHQVVQSMYMQFQRGCSMFELHSRSGGARVVSEEAISPRGVKRSFEPEEAGHPAQYRAVSVRPQHVEDHLAHQSAEKNAAPLPSETERVGMNGMWYD